MAKFEVQHFTLCDGWINTWTIENCHGESKPELFNTFEDAQITLDEFLLDEEESFDQGNTDSMYSRDEFRIIEIVEPYTCPKFEPALEN
jgi:hypothetical protein